MLHRQPLLAAHVVDQPNRFTVRVTLAPTQRVTSISERIQSVLARQVPERTGIEVSDVSILKWCRIYGIKKPPRGYWQKQKTKKKRCTREK